MQYLTPDMSLGEALGLLDLLSPGVVASRRAMQAGRAVDVTALYRKLKSLLALLQCTSPVEEGWGWVLGAGLLLCPSVAVICSVDHWLMRAGTGCVSRASPLWACPQLCSLVCILSCVGHRLMRVGAGRSQMITVHVPLAALASVGAYTLPVHASVVGFVCSVWH